MSNPGPSTTITANAQPVNTQQARRLLAVLKGASVGAAGDLIVPMVNVPTGFTVSDVWSVNGTGDVHLATVGLYTAPAQGGTAIVTTAALTSQTGATYAKSLTVAASTTIIPGQPNLYMNVGTTAAGLAIDLYVYGYDWS